jgi:glycosyltransferase involved in cell wall biosynthesis
LLVVSCTYLLAYNQRKLVEMKRRCKGLQLRILTPRAISHAFGTFRREIASSLSGEEVVDIREFFGRSHMSYLLDPLRFVRVLKQFRPHQIHIEEDPYSVVGVETVFLSRLFCPDAKISFFIWDNLAREPRFPLNLIKWRLNSYSLSKADLVVCGNSEGEVLLRGKKNYKGRSTVLPQLGLDADAYLEPRNEHLRSVLNVPEDVPLVGYVGRLVPEKGVILLLEALQRLAAFPWRAVIIGSGPLEQEITDKWLPRFGGRLLFRKAVSHSEVPTYMRALDIFVLPSYTIKTWKEQFGLVLAQAMLAGVPCVGSTCGAIPEVIGPGGLVFKEKDVTALTTALQRLIIDKSARLSLGEAARKFALSKYTDAVVAEAYLRQFGWHKTGQTHEQTSAGT